jgi:hypothetical protein
MFDQEKENARLHRIVDDLHRRAKHDDVIMRQTYVWAIAVGSFFAGFATALLLIIPLMHR